MQNLVEAQRKYFFQGKTKSIEIRKQHLKKLRELILKNHKELIDAIQLDFKKSEFDTWTTEFGSIIEEIDSQIKNIDHWAKPKKVKTNLVNLPASSWIYPEPYGVSLIIGAWNYPYNLSLTPAVAALAAGNTVILKPSELPAQTSHMMKKLINENFPKELFHVVEGGIAETTELLQQKWDKIFFTGSVPVGKVVYAAAAQNLTPVTLELGGKSPAIFAYDCDLEVSVKRMVWAKFLNAGQTCIAPDYVYVHQSIYEQFLDCVQTEIKKAKYAFENSNYVQIINERNFNRLTKMIAAEKVCIGGQHNLTKRWIEPTVLKNCSWDDACMQDEIFGPILPTLTFDDLDEVITIIQQKPKPLALYLFTEDSETQEKVLENISFGGGCVNDAIMHISNPHLPFGGVGSSGIGNYHGEASFDCFSHKKSILVKPTFFEPNLKYSPVTAGKLNLIKRVLGI